jgi:hypothetical protein
MGLARRRARSPSWPLGATERPRMWNAVRHSPGSTVCDNPEATAANERVIETLRRPEPGNETQFIWNFAQDSSC